MVKLAWDQVGDREYETGVDMASSTSRIPLLVTTTPVLLGMVW